MFHVIPSYAHTAQAVDLFNHYFRFGVLRRRRRFRCWFLREKQNVINIIMIVLVVRGVLFATTSGFLFGSLVVWPSAAHYINFVPFICSQIIFSSVAVPPLPPTHCPDSSFAGQHALNRPICKRNR